MSRLPITLSFYIGRQFLAACGLVLGVFSIITVLIDGMELIRRAYNKDVPFAAIVEMVLLKLPYMMQEIIPFAVLLGGILTFARLTRTSELVVARASGISAWQFLMPALAVALGAGIFLVTIFNPLASVMIKRFEQVENTYIKSSGSMLSVSSSGLWMKQRNKETPGRIVIHALKASQENMWLYDVTVFVFREDNRFAYRVDAERAQLQEGYWYLENVLVTAPDRVAEHQDEYLIKTDIAKSQLQESFARPETLSFWELPGFIEVLKKAGFSALRHRFYWHSVLSVPILLCAMVFIAAAFSLSPPRQGKTGMLIVGGIGVGFLIHFFSGLVSALGMSGSIPIVLAAWAPVGISVLIGAALMLHLEDG